MSNVKFPQAFNDFHKFNGSQTLVYNSEPSLTRQEFAEECDINALMKRYEGHVVGGPGNLSPKEPIYADWTDLPQDLMGYLGFMQEAEAQFMRLPAVVRKEFDNSAMEFVAFATDPGNLEQMRTWGLAAPAKPQDEPAVVSSPSPAPAAASAPAAPAAASTHGST